MKENRKRDIFYSLKGSSKFLLLFIGILIASFTSCSKDEINETTVEDIHLKHSPGAVSTATSMEEITFTATALIEYCHGENIQFTGTIQNRVTTTTDARGVIHYTRSFRTKDMTGTGLPSGTEYDVLGGAEMFAIKDAVLYSSGSLNLPLSIAESDIVIHQGTLVFKSVEDGSIVVARHIIRKVPGQDTTINEWRCGGKG